MVRFSKSDHEYPGNSVELLRIGTCRSLRGFLRDTQFPEIVLPSLPVFLVLEWRNLSILNTVIGSVFKEFSDHILRFFDASQSQKCRSQGSAHRIWRLVHFLERSDGVLILFCEILRPSQIPQIPVRIIRIKANGLHHSSDCLVCLTSVNQRIDRVC